ncbi:hypothetical protein B0H13DRAFT_288101 [Mycena leptocephala]|nr:hypothetical protein B0H13DRAFT_288101 [Mycena leptocephala]
MAGRARLGFPRAKLKFGPARSNLRSTLPDVLWTSLRALNESSDAFPVLKSAVGAVVSICDIAQRAKHSKSDACGIALRTKEILDVVADAVPDPLAIPPLMLQSIMRFTNLLDEIRPRLEAIALTTVISRVLHLNRNERLLQGIKAQLDDAYRDLVAASTLRVEVQQTKIAVQQTKLSVQQTQLYVQQTQTQLDVGQIVQATECLAADLSRLLFYSRFTVFLASP